LNDLQTCFPILGDGERPSRQRETFFRTEEAIEARENRVNDGLMTKTKDFGGERSWTNKPGKFQKDTLCLIFGRAEIFNA